MVVFSIRSRASSRASTRRGFSLPELLVALAVTGMVMGLLIPMVLGVREVVRADQLSTGVNQRVREASDMIGIDIRSAGERFASTGSLQLDPIEIVDGNGVPDEILLRHSLWGSTLPVCEDLAGGSPNIQVVQDAAWLAGNPGVNHPECGQPVLANGWPQNLDEVRTLALDVGTNGELPGYIFDPANLVGEFFTFEVEDNADQSGRIRRTSGNLQNAYALANRPRIYVLSERRYRVRNGVLELVLDGQDADPLGAAGDVTDLQALFVYDGGTTAAALPPGFTWRDIEAIEIALTALGTSGRDEEQATLTSRYFPRNVLSR